jgi:hypothetical protein
VKVLGREIFLHNCDDFTRNYFIQTLNIDVPEPLEEPEPFREDIGALYATGLISHLPSQKRGFGTKSTIYIENQESQDRMNRYFKYAGNVLRFLCVETKDIIDGYHANKEINYITLTDKAKRYALSYFLVDRSIDIRVVKSIIGKPAGPTILEESMLIIKKSQITKNWRQVQNSKAVTPVYFEPDDLYSGKTVDIYGRIFLLISCDKSTRDSYSQREYDLRDIPIVPYQEKPIVHPVPRMGDGFIAIGSEEGNSVLYWFLVPVLIV